jgi:ribosomal protein L11 methyltransferase
MNWIECKLSVPPVYIDNLIAVLSDYIPSGFVIEDDAEMHNFLDENPFNWDYIDDELRNKPIGKLGCLTFYLPVDAMETLKIIENIVRTLNIEYELTTDVKDDTEWLEKWKEFYKTFQIGDGIIIKPYWENDVAPDNGKTVFTINPGSVFGTGLHQTTQLCLLELEKIIKLKTPNNILDLGCGSGILSIITLMMAKSNGVNACAVCADFDPAAVTVVDENARMNGVGDNLRFISGNVLSEDFRNNFNANAPYDLIFANITADVIISLCEYIPPLLAKNGVYVISGIIEERLNDVKEALIHIGFTVNSVSCADNWYAINTTYHA